MLPCSSGRRAEKFLKLLCSVDAEAQHGFGFEGKFMRPGATVTTAELHPSPDYPDRPLMLEHTRTPAKGIVGGRRKLSLYILWQYDDRTHGWLELGRAASASWEWAMELRPLALRALREGRGQLVPAKADLPAIATRISRAIGMELEALDPPERIRVIAIIHDEFAMRLAR